ncbi:MAPEG family protein [Microvirga massiliensis]|uniref:MAPEG family protein n=1 Tax=Microvirga massiliensis TaxID=1033741 RepID=UPI00062BCB4E|nr:MAPEG family protein [Microvirga massiliensis]
MGVGSILAPVFVRVALTLVLLAALGHARVGALRAGLVRMDEIALGERRWPTSVQKLANAFHNQLELPVLFYLVVVIALLTRQADVLFVILSWCFVLMRLVHAAIHITTNVVAQRFQVFSVGVILLAILWMLLAWRILAGDTP